MNEVHLSGNVTKDPELKRTINGTPVCSFSIAVKSGEEAQFIDCVAWKNCAERVAANLHKGSFTMIYGRLNVREWTDKQGDRRRKYEVAVNEFCGADKRKQHVEYEDLTGTDEDLPF